MVLHPSNILRASIEPLYGITSIELHAILRIVASYYEDGHRAVFGLVVCL